MLFAVGFASLRSTPLTHHAIQQSIGNESRDNESYHKTES